MRHTIKILPSRIGNLAKLQLNNPAALQALTIDMVHSFTDTLTSWNNDPSLYAFLVEGGTSLEGKPKAFCAGGDVKSIYKEALQDFNDGNEKAKLHGHGHRDLASSDFFRDEYQLNYLLATQSLSHARAPQISIWNGLVLGGGVGISQHGAYRIATQNTLYGMPETKIGLFPDVGSTYWMSRSLEGGMANYLALTGKILNAQDCLYAGLATHYVPEERLEELVEALIQAGDINGEKILEDGNESSQNELNSYRPPVTSVLMRFHETDRDLPESYLKRHRAEINAAFSDKKRIEDIFEALEQMKKNESSSDQKSTFATQSLETLHSMSPTALKLTLEGLSRGKQLKSIAECLQMEFRMMQRCMRRESDFYEGIRAVLIDKTKGVPNWNPSTVEGVQDEDINEFFKPLDECNELLLSSVGVVLSSSKL